MVERSLVTFEICSDFPSASPSPAPPLPPPLSPPLPSPSVLHRAQELLIYRGHQNRGGGGCEAAAMTAQRKPTQLRSEMGEKQEPASQSRESSLLKLSRAWCPSPPHTTSNTDTWMENTWDQAWGSSMCPFWRKASNLLLFLAA